MKNLEEKQVVAAAEAQPQQEREAYTAPSVEVIKVQTEKGYASSADGYPNGGNW